VTPEERATMRAQAGRAFHEKLAEISDKQLETLFNAVSTEEVAI
jgi:hypothetical protein